MLGGQRTELTDMAAETGSALRLADVRLPENREIARDLGMFSWCLLLMYPSKPHFFNQLERRFHQELLFDFHARRLCPLDRRRLWVGSRADLRTGCGPECMRPQPWPDLPLCETWTKPMGIATFDVSALHLRQLDAF
jgi:hypothetical protein